MLDSKTIVIILSDGWDKGNMDLLQKSMEFIQAKSKKIIWLNPLAGFAFLSPRCGRYANSYAVILMYLHLFTMRKV